jgi:carboxyl-terminal processing protease
VFQEIEPLSNGGALELVVGRWFLPHGQNVTGTGIQPQVSAQDDEKTAKDEALDTALSTVRSKIG